PAPPLFGGGRGEHRSAARRMRVSVGAAGQAPHRPGTLSLALRSSPRARTPPGVGRWLHPRPLSCVVGRRRERHPAVSCPPHPAPNPPTRPGTLRPIRPPGAARAGGGPLRGCPVGGRATARHPTPTPTVPFRTAPPPPQPGLMRGWAQGAAEGEAPRCQATRRILHPTPPPH